jgi:exopolyphosphatase/guanosine-5'-triphosphate,3'-diphosphate pyrophosphatase
MSFHVEENSEVARRRAVIDVGTNSVKLLVADVSRETIIPVLEESEQTRLGRGFYQNHELQPDAIRQTAAAIERFITTARSLGAGTPRVIATSAARDAKNPGDLIGAIKDATGESLEIISGQQEADWAFAGVAEQALFRDRPLLLLDVGGGSTEFILGESSSVFFRRSFPMGTVRLLERVLLDDPPGEAALRDCRRFLTDFIQNEVEPEVKREMAKHPGCLFQLVGTGGTAAILGRMHLQMEEFDRDQIEKVVLSRREIQDWAEQQWRMTLERRRKTPGLPPNRADVILTGMAIYEAIMAGFGFEELRVSTRGLRFAVLRETACS